MDLRKKPDPYAERDRILSKRLEHGRKRKARLMEAQKRAEQQVQGRLPGQARDHPKGQPNPRHRRSPQ